MVGWRKKPEAIHGLYIFLAHTQKQLPHILEINFYRYIGIGIFRYFVK